MTVSTTISRTSYSGNDVTTAFAFPYKFLADGDLVVSLINAAGIATTQTITTQYTVSGAGTDSSGQVTMITPPATGETLVIYRSTAITQDTDYIVGDAFPAETHETALDRLTLINQELETSIARTFRLSDTDTSGASTDIPSPIANYVLGWDSAGTSLTNVQELGSYRGTDATTTTASYFERDLVKSTTAGQLDNIYICVQDAPAGTLLTNTSYFALIVDAVSAATSASNAAASESAASTSASNAATSESNAATSESNAATSEANAAASFDSFDDRYLGAKASDPALDNDGDPLLTGALYYNTTASEIRAYDGAAWSAGYVPDSSYAKLAVAQTFTASQRGTVTADNDLSFDLNVTNNFKCTPTGIGTLTFTNITAGQSGNIWLDNSGGHAISAAATTYISSADLTTISTAGVYFMSYYADGTNVLVSVSRALTSAGA